MNKYFRALLVMLVLLGGRCVSSPLRAQVKEAVATDQAGTAPLTVDDVLKMTKAGLSDDVIVTQLKQANQPFKLTTAQLIQLKSASVSDRVIKTMMNPSAEAPAAAASPSASTPAVDPSLPTEVGIYAKRQDKWTEVLPEVVNWKTGGVLKSFASGGIVKGDVNGHLVGRNSRNSYTTPIEFLIVAPEGTAITEYQLLHLRENGENREFRTMTGGVMHVASGATRDLVPFEGKKISPHTYAVVFPANLGAGEFGFLPPGAIGAANAAGSAGKLYSFRVIE